MKIKNLRTLALITLMVLSVSYGFGFDFGVSIDSITTLGLPGTDGPDLGQRVKVALWTDYVRTSESGNILTFSGQGYYVYTLERPYLFDLERLFLRLRLPSLFDGKAVGVGNLGRFRFTDPSGFVMNHRADGASFALDFQGNQITLKSGYTGLLLKEESRISYSSADFEDKTDQSILTSPNRIFQELEFRSTSLVPRQTLGVSVLAQQDLRSTDPENSVYGQLFLNGPLVSGLFYNFFGILGYGFGAETADFIGNLRVSYFLPQVLNSRITLGFLGVSNEYRGLSLNTTGFLYPNSFNGMVRIAGGYSMRPFGNYYSPVMRNLAFTVDGRTFFQTADGFAYSGVEFEGGITFRPATDLGVSLRGGMYVPPEGQVNSLLIAVVSTSF